MDAPDAALLSANDEFYEAFNQRDLGRMEALWATSASIVCVHPGWPALIGRSEVMRSWRGILANPRAPKVRCTGATAHVYGDAAFVVCTEVVDDEALVATNVFCREDGAWKLVHHHAGPTAQRPARTVPRPPPTALN